MSNIEWIFLDMGGTFIDETAAWEDRIRRTAAANDIPVPVDGTLTYGTNDVARKAERFREEMQCAAADNLPEYPTAMQKFGIRYKEPWSFEHERLYEGTEEVLRRLHERYRLGVIANQPENARQRLLQFGVLQYFDHLTISGEIGYSKPSPTIFRETLRIIGTTAEKCVMAGDKLTNDIAPAKKLGFRTVWVKQEYGGMNRITDQSMAPDFTVESFSALPEIFLK
ncbi:MAG: HAD family hydrolase [Oscillospiraceae bacterium]|nr:HAD family hydrolase [Oscillospiraceae bacterium]